MGLRSFYVEEALLVPGEAHGSCAVAGEIRAGMQVHSWMSNWFGVAPKLSLLCVLGIAWGIGRCYKLQLNGWGGAGVCNLAYTHP